jgi:hypothetical protein
MLMSGIRMQSRNKCWIPGVPYLVLRVLHTRCRWWVIKRAAQGLGGGAELGGRSRSIKCCSGETSGYVRRTPTTSPAMNPTTAQQIGSQPS